MKRTLMKRLLTIGLALCAPVLFLSCASPSAYESVPKASPQSVGMDAARLERIDSAIHAAISDRQIPGAVVAVVRHQRLVYLKAYGHKQWVPDTLPMTTDAVFDLASVSKCVGTTLSFMQLMERGQVRLEDRVDTYIPNFAPWTDTATGQTVPITIQDLMTHTSGLPAYGPTEQLVAQYGSPAPEGLLSYISTCPRLFRPTTNYEYSCLNFITLQHILQRITGQRLCDYAQENLFTPLGLRSTMYLPLDAPVPSVTDAQRQDVMTRCCPTELQADGRPLTGQVHDPLARLLNAGNSGNAGVFSDAQDLAVIAAALLNGGTYHHRRILSPQTVAAMTRIPQPVASLGRTLGWAREGSWNGNLFNPQTVYGHTGYTGTSIVLDPESDVAVIVLANRVHPHDQGSAVRLRTVVANIVAGAIME